VSRIGLGRHGRIEESAGDPLDGLVNLFDVGIVLAVAFLVAGLGLTVDPRSGRVEPRARTQALPSPAQAPTASGRGEAVGTVYRLGDGRLVLVQPGGRRRTLVP
jgi:hypothetical protein